MGAKTGLIAYSDGDLVERLRGAPTADPVKTEDLVELVYPGWPRSPAEGCTLIDGTYPPDDIVYAGSFCGVDVVCSQRLMLDRPSELPTPIVEASREDGSSCTRCTALSTGSPSPSGRTAG